VAPAIAADTTIAASNAESDGQKDVQTRNLPDFKYGDENQYIQFYGQINKAFVGYDDGQSTRAYYPVDNASSPTRVGLAGFRGIDDDVWIGSTVAVGWRPYTTGKVNQLNNSPDWDNPYGLRKAEIYLNSENFGRLWVGQGSMASDDTSQADLSRTTLSGYAQVSDIAAAQLLRTTSGALTEIKLSNVFNDFDGVGRKLRIRYDTPAYNGFVFGASIGRKVVPKPSGTTNWDMSVKYSNMHGNFNVAGALAFYDKGKGKNGKDKQGLDGSISTLHVPSGISLTFSGAMQQQAGPDAKFFYTKLGYQTDYFNFGKTAFSVDAYWGQNINAIDSGSVAFGIQAVQEVDAWATQFYLGIRSYEYKDADDDYQDGMAAIAGSRIRF